MNQREYQTKMFNIFFSVIGTVLTIIASSVAINVSHIPLIEANIQQLDKTLSSKLDALDKATDNRLVRIENRLEKGNL